MSAEIIPIDVRAREEARAGTAERPRCRATTRDGRPCRKYAVDQSGYCQVHGPTARHPSRSSSSTGSDRDARPAFVGERRSTAQGPSDGRAASLESFVNGAVDWLRHRMAGDYPIDDFGFDPRLHRDVLVPLIEPLYRHYFRVQALGLQRIPAEGPALIVGNHSGAIALDAVMVQHAVATEHAKHRLVRNIGADLVFQAPFLGHLARKGGTAVACTEDATELLRRGELVGVYPEGFKGVGKGWRERYRLQRFGRGGFIEVALKTRTPIIPVAVVGAEEAYPMLGSIKPLARILGVPYFPVTPTFPWLGPLGLLPLPSRWIIEFGEPIPMDAYPEDADDDPMLVFDLADGIRDTIQQMVLTNLKRRRGVFL